MSKRKSSFNQIAKQQLLTGTTFTASPEAVRLFQHYKTIALNRYRWENLPNGIESRHIEKFLFENGQVFFVEDTLNGLLCLPCSPIGLNIYGDPTGYNVSGTGYSKSFKADKGVRILNDDLGTPTRLHIQHFADRMAQVDDLIQKNLKQQKFPFYFSTTKQTERTFKTIFNKMERGEEAFFIDETLTDEGRLGVNVLNLNIPYLVDKLTDYKTNLEKDLLTFLGLNSTIEKKERLLVDETNANNSFVEMNLDLGFKQREEAAKAINEKFGLNVKVVKTTQLLEPTFDTTLNGQGEEILIEDDLTSNPTHTSPQEEEIKIDNEERLIKKLFKKIIEFITIDDDDDLKGGD